MFKTFRFAALAALLCTPAHAVTYSFEASFDSASPDNATLVDTIVDRARDFTTISGTLTFDPVSTGPSLFPGGAEYNAPVLSVNEFTLPTLQSASDPILQVFNDVFLIGGSTVDSISSASLPPATPTGPLITQTFGLSFVDSTATALGSTAFPASIDLADFDSATIFFGAGNFNGTAFDGEEQAFFNFTEFTLIPDTPAVPLPGALPLLAGALFGTAALRRARRVNK